MAYAGILEERLKGLPCSAFRAYDAAMEIIHLALCSGLLTLRGTDWQLLRPMQPYDTLFVKYSLIFNYLETSIWGLGWFYLHCPIAVRNQYWLFRDSCLLCMSNLFSLGGLVYLTMLSPGLHINGGLSWLLDIFGDGALALVLRFLHLSLRNFGKVDSFIAQKIGRSSLPQHEYVPESIHSATGSRSGMDWELLRIPLPCYIRENQDKTKATCPRLSFSGRKCQQLVETCESRDTTERRSMVRYIWRGSRGFHRGVPRSAILCLLKEEASLVRQFLGEWVLSAGAAVSASSVAALIDVLMGSIAGQLAWRLPSPLWISFPWPVAALAAALVARATLGAASHLGLSRLQAKLHGALGARASATAWGAAAASPRVLSALIREVLAPCAWLASAVSAMLAFSPDHALALALCATAAASLGGCAESPTSQLGARIRVAVCQAVGIVTVAALACVNLTTESRKEVIAAETVASCLLMAHLGDTISALRRGSRLIVAAACDAFEDDQLC
mmetsp:Transcript_40520/g.96291  ORF Transcript_40520/g.96291 Transcript_40520/m.96291 type:complete len:503 (-) Transcript_40520:350-1858(-)